MFDSRHLRTFRAVVDEGSFSAAARELGYTQPAVSQQMRALERAAGTPLFTRVGRVLKPTDAGHMLFRHAVDILSSLSAAEEQIATVRRLRSGRVRLCTFPSAGATIIPAAVARLAEEHPGIRVELVETEPPDSLCALRRGECDVTLAFDYRPGPAEPPEEPADDLVAVPLLDDRVVVVLPRDHPLRRRHRVHLADLAEERWIAGCSRCRGHFVRACADAGFEPDIAFTTDDNLAVQSLVAAGAGVAFMPGLVLSCLRHPGVAGRPVEPAAHRRVTAYTLREYERVPATRLLLRVLEETSRRLARGGFEGTAGIVGLTPPAAG
ncbi:LysR family transcriptional regulator [Nocardiopsis potens]|uniref:LysR family transcriptional regulator n=1 Tax=Nocardiopsis potens TaxID=1246458 RepID=UPI0005953884|nr:LysR family transcriptional regulator [Nocardiopsis potens]